MLFEKWENDICQAILALTGKDYSQADEKDAATANKLLFSLINSYIWQGMTGKVELFVSDENPNYSYVNVEITYEDEVLKEQIHIFEGRYEDAFEYYQDHLDVLWPRPKSDSFTIYTSDLFFIDELSDYVNELSKTTYYARLLERDPDQQQRNLMELKDISYLVMEHTDSDCANQLIDLTGTSTHSMASLRHVFAHKYVNYVDGRHILVAHNFLGPVGVMLLFDHDYNKVLDRDADRLSISAVSVTPAYRNMGIAKELLRKAFEFAEKNQKYLCRTSPTKLGEKYTLHQYAQLAKREFPHIPFVNHEEKEALRVTKHITGFSGMPYQQKCDIINDIIEQYRDIRSSDPNVNYFCLSENQFSVILTTMNEKLLASKKVSEFAP